MRVPLSWLRDYVDLDLSPRDLAERLTLLGFEVKGIEEGGGEWSGVVVGRVLAVERHPNADTLWVTSVDVAAGEPLEIVCGAQNVAAGQLVPVAVPGSVLPGGRKIERTKIRGAVSNGMLCSPIELGLGEDADGILILGTGNEHPVGADLGAAIGETVLDVDVKPNRGDALSMVGIAREIAAATGTTVRLPEVSVAESGGATADAVSVEIVDPDLCPRFTARLLENVGQASTPEWMTRRLIAAGMRPISPVVDVTNYVMHELGQPQHAYDADRIPGGRIVVRRAREGESLETIDHVRRTLDDRMLVIADRERAIGLAGIMGGADTEVTDATRRVILESAIFHGPTIRNSARRLGFRSEASTRHEKGISVDLPRLAADRAAALIAEITGAQVATGIVDNDPGPHAERVIAVDTARMTRLLGFPVELEAMVDWLEPLGFSVADRGDGRADVTVPLYRQDVVIPADVAEEVARARGYDTVPSPLPSPDLPPHRPDPSGQRHALRRALAGFGLDEVVTHALIGPDDLDRTGFDPESEHLVRVANPLSPEHAILRPIPYPSVFAALAENVRQRRTDLALFEVGKTYRYRSGAGRGELAQAGGAYRETWNVGIGLLGSSGKRRPGEPSRPWDIADLKGLVDAAHEAMGRPAPGYRAETAEERHAHLHPGRAARIVDDAGRSYGSLGEAHPAVAEAWGLPGRPLVAAIHLEPGGMFDVAPRTERAVPVPAAQPIDRDLAVVVDAGTPVGEVLRLAAQNGGPLLVDVSLFDEYRGAQIGEGRVSYGLALRFQPMSVADEKAVARAMDKIGGALRHHLGAEIR
ncbi:MAG TPA: phenylalanine--tRNA ligase subunit beta [Candidatus Limnocylindria bacterium]|nr:phenylalanine--tRNA ligase subunit beta [Candidatus Limnocylindria bacterium]